MFCLTDSDDPKFLTPSYREVVVEDAVLAVETAKKMSANGHRIGISCLARTFLVYKDEEPKTVRRWSHFYLGAPDDEDRAVYESLFNAAGLQPY